METETTNLAQKHETIPTGKLNTKGQMVTDPEELKKLYATEFKERLRSRPTHPQFLHIQTLKDSIFKLKMEKAKCKTTDDWTIKELEIVLKDINKGKSRDPDGFSREMFHPSVIGDNLKESLLIMFNKLKQHGEIPHFMKKKT